MNIFRLIKEAIYKLIPYKEISSLEKIESPISAEMQKALSDWQAMYQAKPDWLDDNAGVHTMNIPALVCSEIARQILLEVKWSITGTEVDKTTGETLSNPRSEFLTAEFQKCMDAIRPKLEVGCAAGGFAIKPYPFDGHFNFSYIFNWDLYPEEFDNSGSKLNKVIFPDKFQRGKTYYTRLEKHEQDGKNVVVTNRAFRSTNPNTLGNEINLSEVSQWADLQPSATVSDANGQLFGWFKTANANTIDINCPLGAAVFDKAADVIRQADEKMYSALLWEFEASQLAVDVDFTVLRPRQDADGVKRTVPRLQQRLFRGVNMPPNGEKSSFYNLFSPTIRDTSYISGLNQLLIRIEDLCGLSRGTLSDANTEARTATELKIVKQRSYATIADNQKNLEKCLRDVIRAMDVYATVYGLVPEEKTPEERRAAQGSYEVSFEWDDSIITDSQQQMSEMLLLLDRGIISAEEMRQWYKGETKQQAAAAIAAIREEKAREQENAITLPNLNEGGDI